MRLWVRIVGIGHKLQEVNQTN
ncbi:protein of unknown function [Pseudorhizobium banfieldiae]|uniref:Uncharacterized protein n=1 Tax=Pseudorhizobium banfieldiae TaxID=1125847 RepID=L0NAD2_9HYPH|nr:protein of unknown function [Pseudorhizobium banfieldiae]